MSRTNTTPSGVEYNINRISHENVTRSTIERGRHCKLVQVTIANSTAHNCGPLRIPCLSCAASILPDPRDYYSYYRSRLVVDISRAVFPRLQRACINTLADDVIDNILRPANDVSHSTSNDVSIYVSPIRVPVPRVSGPPRDDIERDFVRLSFEEEGPRRKRAKVESLTEMVKARDERLAKEDGALLWVGSEHECSICMDEIEKARDSLTMPCFHVFHEKCLTRWLDDDHVCPLCRHKLPTEA